MEDAQYTQYYVAFLDILGFKNLVNNQQFTCQDILNLYDYLEYRHKEFFEGESESLRNSIKMKIMSDSICLYTEADSPNALFLLLAYCVTFQHDLLVQTPCVLIRGGITVGGMYAKGDVTFGPALTEAYLIEEKNAKVPRIIIRKETLDSGMNNIDKDKKELIYRWIFRDDDAFYALDYFRLLVERDDKEALVQVNLAVSDQLDKTIDESIRQKYLYVEKRINKWIEGKTNA